MCRDASTEVFKTMKHHELVGHVAQVQAASAPSAAVSVCTAHVRDEALFRMRSHLREASASLCRARYSKILNHDISVHVGEEESSWIAELQPLRRKDANTIATGLILPGREIMEHLAPQFPKHGCQRTLRLVHLMTTLLRSRPETARQGASQHWSD